jgi:hypothetical protein
MRKDHKAATIKFIISYDPVKPADVEACKAIGITLLEYMYVVE